jgi:glutamine amidotransferase
MANRADRLRDAIHQERAVIGLPATDQPTGWGIGFYQGGEVLHKKRPLLDGAELDWDSIVGDVRSDCVVVHVRHATVGDFRSENTHPFRMRSWLCAHSGTIHRFEAIKPRLLDTMPDFIRRNVRGETDSEHFFHAALSFLHDAGQLDRPDVDDKSVLNAIRSTVRLVDRLGKEVSAPDATLNVVLTNGRHMYAVRRGLPMVYVERSGLHDPRDTDERADKMGGVRYVLVASDVVGVPVGYVQVPESSVAIIDRNLAVSIHSL